MQNKKDHQENLCLKQKLNWLCIFSFQTSQYSKLEKADILEMTVKHLQSVQRQQLVLAAASDSTVVGKYRAGFSECAQEVTRYLSQVEGMNSETRGKLELHLQTCLQGAPRIAKNLQSQPQVNGHPANHQLHVGIPAGTPMTSLPGAVPQTVQQVPVLNAQGVPQFFGAVQMVPGNVMGTDVTLLLPTSQMCSNMTPLPNNHQAGRASVSPSSNRSSPSSTVSRDSICTPSPSSLHQMASPSHHVTSHHMTPSKSWPQMAPPQNMPVNVQFNEEKVWRPW